MSRIKQATDSMPDARFRHPDFPCCCNRCWFENYLPPLPLRPAFRARPAVLADLAEFRRYSGLLEFAANTPVIPHAAPCHKDLGIARIRRACNTWDTGLSRWLRPAVSMAKINAHRRNNNINYRHDCQDNLTPHHFPFRKSYLPSLLPCSLPTASHKW